MTSVISTPLKLPGCRELLNLCDHYPRPTIMNNDIEIPPITLPLSRSLNQAYLDQHDSRNPIPRKLNLKLKPYPASPTSPTDGKPRKRKDTIDREEVRRAKLENDPWSDKTKLTPKSVFCLGCKRDIRLDRRNDYYPGLWLKHRGLCQGIAKLKSMKRESMSPEVTLDFKSDSSEEPEEPIIHCSEPKIPIMKDEEAALILIEMMNNRRMVYSSSDSDTSSSYSGA